MHLYLDVPRGLMIIATAAIALAVWVGLGRNDDRRSPPKRERNARYRPAACSDPPDAGSRPVLTSGARRAALAADGITGGLTRAG